MCTLNTLGGLDKQFKIGKKKADLFELYIIVVQELIGKCATIQEIMEREKFMLIDLIVIQPFFPERDICVCNNKQCVRSLFLFFFFSLSLSLENKEKIYFSKSALNLNLYLFDSISPWPPQQVKILTLQVHISSVFPPFFLSVSSVLSSFPIHLSPTRTEKWPI